MGVGLPYAITVSIFGGTADYIALWFKQAGTEAASTGMPPPSSSARSLVYFLMRDTAQPIANRCGRPEGLIREGPNLRGRDRREPRATETQNDFKTLSRS